MAICTTSEAEREGEDEMINGKGMSNVEAFIRAITMAAISDAEKGISEYHKCNTGAELLNRLDLKSHRAYPRKGDGKYARSIYTAVHWLYRTESDN